MVNLLSWEGNTSIERETQNKTDNLVEHSKSLHTETNHTVCQKLRGNRLAKWPIAYFGYQIRFQPLSPAAPDRFDYGSNHRQNLISTLLTAGCQSCVLAKTTIFILFHGHRKEACGLLASCLIMFVLPEEAVGFRRFKMWMFSVWLFFFLKEVTSRWAEQSLSTQKSAWKVNNNCQLKSALF